MENKNNIGKNMKGDIDTSRMSISQMIKEIEDSLKRTEILYNGTFRGRAR